MHCRVTEHEQKNILANWLDQYKGIILKVARAYAHSTMDQDDLFQEITLQVWHSIQSFRHESAVSTWIYRISLNTAIKWIRQERKHNASETLDGVESVLPDQLTRMDERVEWLYEEIHKLDKVDRSIALLLLDGFSYKEMAGIIGITESNIGVRINRIKKQLIEKSKEHHYGI